MKLSTLIRIFILFGIVFSGYVSYSLVMMNDRALPWWNFFYGELFCVCMACGWGLSCQKRWAYWLSLVLAAACLGLGLYFVHFAWTFWIFKQPSLADRILAVLNLRIFIFTLIPVVWGVFFTRANVRSYFQS